MVAGPPEVESHRHREDTEGTQRGHRGDTERTQEVSSPAWERNQQHEQDEQAEAEGEANCT